MTRGPKRKIGLRQYMRLDEVAANICATPEEFLAMVESGELPEPVIHGGKTLWKWSAVDAALAGGYGEAARVYFVQAGDYIKIGFTTELAYRVQQIAWGRPDKTTLLHHVPGDRDRETDYHRKFRHIRIRGDWYRMEPELLEFIEKLKAERP